MPCGVTKNGVVCDNTGTSAHAGMHSGVTNISWLFGLTKRVFWANSNSGTTPAAQGPLTVGTRIPTTVAPIITGLPGVGQTSLLNLATSQTFVIPAWANFIDYVLLPGGGGGREGDGAFGGTGNGGDAGQFVSGTLVRGTDFAAGVTSGSVTIGGGGAAGAKGAGNVIESSRGGTTTITVGAFTTSAIGGAGGSGTGGDAGGSPGTLEYQEIVAVGGGTAPSGSSRTVGKTPGGGGGGGQGGMFNGQTAGMAGAPGYVWLGFRS